MSFNQQIIKELLETIKENVDLIDSMQISHEAIMEDIDIQHLLERRIHLAVEAAIDVASHLAAVLSLPGRETAKDVFGLLEKEQIITHNLSLKMQQAVGLRNILVHEYGKINHEKLFRSYKDDLQDLREFIREIINFLEKKAL